MKTKRKIEEYRCLIQKCIQESDFVKSNQPNVIFRKDYKNHTILYRGSAIGDDPHDALWFVDSSCLRFIISIKCEKESIKEKKYSIQWQSKEKKNLFYFRYEWDESYPGVKYHPEAHLHINDYKDIRFPTGRLKFQEIFRFVEDLIEKRKNLL